MALFHIKPLLYVYIYITFHNFSNCILTSKFWVLLTIKNYIITTLFGKFFVRHFVIYALTSISNFLVISNQFSLLHQIMYFGISECDGLSFWIFIKVNNTILSSRNIRLVVIFYQKCHISNKNSQRIEELETISSSYFSLSLSCLADKQSLTIRFISNFLFIYITRSSLLLPYLFIVSASSL